MQISPVTTYAVCCLWTSCHGCKANLFLHILVGLRSTPAQVPSGYMYLQIHVQTADYSRFAMTPLIFQRGKE
jgi:hypothetical protein